MTMLVLLSGGVDSATLLRRELRGRSIIGLFVDYGQRAAGAERRAARTQCQALNVSLTELGMAAVGEAFRAEHSERKHVPLPSRNLVILALGVSYAEQIGAQRLALAVNRDCGRCPPCRKQRAAFACAGVAEPERFYED